MPADTGFPELDAVLAGLVAEATRVLGTDLVGVYLVGSFALGDADEHSDVDVLLPVTQPLTAAQEAGVRAVHARLPVPEGHWSRELEGSLPAGGGPADDGRARPAVALHPVSLRWAARELAPEWRPLIEAALTGRALGWDPDDAPTREAVDATERFARYAARVAAHL